MAKSMIEQRVHRILADLNGFSPSEGHPIDGTTPLGPDEKLLGSLRLTTDGPIEMFFSDQGVHFQDGSWVNIPYRELVDASVSDVGAKRDADTVVLSTRDGNKVKLRASRRVDQFSDSWDLLRFFQRVISDATGEDTA